MGKNPMSPAEQTFIFGPVPSRRLGHSLGVDVIPFKTCTYNCIYCQLGQTTDLTITRRRYAPTGKIMEQLRQRLSDGPQPDYITLSGSGEPTLHAGLGELIGSIKRHTRIPVAVLTNGSLLWDGMVQRALAGADLVIPSLDAGDPRVFQRVNRPHPALDFEQVTKGLVEFRRGFDGQIWLEVFLVEGVNATSEDVLSIRELADSIEPDRIQLNTVVRPAAEDYALRVSNADMDRIRAVFGNRAEVIAPYETAPVPAHGSAVADDILEMLRRRPCTLDDVAAGLGIHRNEAIKYLAKLVETHLAEKIGQDSTTFYRACESSNAHAEERNRT